MQMDAEERQDTAFGRYPAPLTDVATHALRIRGSVTTGSKGNPVVEETTICRGYSSSANPMMTRHSGLDTAEMTGRHCGSVGDLKLGTDKVSA